MIPAFSVNFISRLYPNRKFRLKMLKYFSNVVEEPINTGGRKAIHDMQSIIKNFLVNEKISYQEYCFRKLSSRAHLLLPSPHSKYMFFGYLGDPFFKPPLVVGYTFFFFLVAIKKRIVKEKYYIIVPDLIELQSTVLYGKKGWLSSFFKNFQCFLERFLLSNVADEVISLAEKNFMQEKYGTKQIWELEFLDHCTDVTSSSNSKNIRVLYCGDLGSRKGVRIEFFEEVLNNLPISSEFWLAASGIDKKDLKRLEKFKNFRFLGQMEIEEMNNIAKQCNFGLIYYLPEILYYNILPSMKLSFYISNGLTVVSSNLERTKQLNDKYDFGYVLKTEEMLGFFRNLTIDMAKQNHALQEKIATGQFLYEALQNLDLS